MKKIKKLLDFNKIHSIEEDKLFEAHPIILKLEKIKSEEENNYLPLVQEFENSNIKSK